MESGLVLKFTWKNPLQVILLYLGEYKYPYDTSGKSAERKIRMKKYTAILCTAALCLSSIGCSYPVYAAESVTIQTETSAESASDEADASLKKPDGVLGEGETPPAKPDGASGENGTPLEKPTGESGASGEGSTPPA